MMESYLKKLKEAKSDEEKDKIITEAFRYCLERFSTAFDGLKNTDFPIVVGVMMAYLEAIEYTDPTEYEIGKRFYEENKGNFTAVIIENPR